MARSLSSRKEVFFTITILFTLFTSTIHAQDGNIDPTFTAEFSSAAFVAGGLQSDGKVILAGAWSIGEEDAIQGIIRLNSDGSIDDTFNVINSGLITSSVRKIIIQEDDKILIAGVFIMLNGVPRRYIARLHPDGQIDESFDPGESIDGGGPFGSSIEDMALQPDGKIVIGGRFNHYNGQSVANGVIRLNADGSLDTTFDATPAFGPDMVPNNFLGIDIQSDGKIILGGIFDYGEGAYGDDISGIVRLHSDGSFDDSFNTLDQQSKEGLNISDLKVDGLDNIYVNGQLWGFNPEFIYTQLTTRFKLNPDGTVNDTHLNSTYFQSSFSSYDITILSDWKSIYSGYYSNLVGNDYYGVMRSLPNGMFDIMFNNEIPVQEPGGTAFIEQPDGKILCYGAVGNYNDTLVTGIWRIENTPDPPCGVTFEVFPDPFNDNTLLVVPEYDGFPDLGFLWSYGDGNTSNEMYPYHTYSDDGEYELCATLTASENGSAFCMESFCFTVSDEMASGLIANNGQTIRENGFSINVIHPNSVGISELQQPKIFEIFPNPSDGEIYLRTDLPHAEIITVSICNSAGQVFNESRFSIHGGLSDCHVFDLSNHPAGVYLVQISSERFQEVQRVVIH